jgi:hypothetical protein
MLCVKLARGRDISGRSAGLVAVLHAAAQLVGTPQADDTAIQIPLVVGNLNKLHKRRVYEAWNAGGRCGRWSALFRLGASIGLRRNLNSYRRIRNCDSTSSPTG